ncbi:peptidylprolyl isomerase [bacterium]|nr:peptidylprolyl isomerase [bacterium]
MRFFEKRRERACPNLRPIRGRSCRKAHLLLVLLVVELVVPSLPSHPLWNPLWGPLNLRAEQRIPFRLPPRRELLKIRSAVLKTSKGEIVFELFPETAPWHVANFKYLADKNFYDGIRFHVHQPGKIIQGGTPRADRPDGGPGYELPPEFSEKRHQRGVLGMSRKPDILNPSRKSHGSQFHILLTNADKMNGSFTVFGQVVRGMEVADSLERGDTIENLTVYIRQ